MAVSMLPMQNQIDKHAQFGILWVVLANAFMNIGFIARIVASLRISRSQIDAAKMDGAGPLRIFWSIEMPARFSSLSGAALIVALYSATSYGIVLVLGRGLVQTLETEIADAALQRLDLNYASFLALLQTVLTIALFGLSRMFRSEPSAVFGKIAVSHNKVSKFWGVVSWAFLFLVIALLGSVIIQGLGSNFPESLGYLGSQGSRSVLNVTFVEAALNSLRNICVTLLIASPIAWWLSGKRASWILLLSGVSPVVFGLFALIGSGYLPRVISGSWLLLPFVQSLFLLPLLYQLFAPARQGLDHRVRESAQLDGANWLQRTMQIEFPLLRKPIVTAVAFAALAGLGEFGAGSFLALGDQTTLPVAMVRLLSRPGDENLQMAMLAGSFFILFAAFIVWLISSEREN